MWRSSYYAFPVAQRSTYPATEAAAQSGCSAGKCAAAAGHDDPQQVQGASRRLVVWHPPSVDEHKRVAAAFRPRPGQRLRALSYLCLQDELREK